MVSVHSRARAEAIDPQPPVAMAWALAAAKAEDSAPPAAKALAIAAAVALACPPALFEASAAASTDATAVALPCAQHHRVTRSGKANHGKRPG